ncbi:MAG: DNA methyltransferase, partial [Bacteroidales bacterium]|nr:DNA methyltransferase [Bacteroidales bacterium]
MPSSTDIQRRAAARDFAIQWKDRGDEKQETQRYWISLLGDVLGTPQPANAIEFEKRVKLTHTSFIDAYIPATHVLIEQKSIDIDLTKAYAQSDGASLTPFEQAKRYANEMPHDQHPRWIVVSNFAEIHIHDMNRPADPPEVVRLADLEKEYYRLLFLVDAKSENIRREEQVSIQAGVLVHKLYNALIKQYVDPTPDSLRSLNILCVRLVFCLYAEDAGLFASRTAFEDYIRSFNIQNVRKGLIDLFKALDTKEADRDKYDETIRPFPYVNGGLFKDEQIEIPNFTPEIVDVIVNDCAPFNWSDISPTIFGAVFESTLNPDTRRAGGMHYTSVENIHKVIDPLFMEDLEAEFAQIMNTTAVKTRRQQLHDFQKKLGGLKFLDPACGSGNFLTEAFLSLRRLENRVISALNDGEAVLGLDNFIQVDISQFYGIEINDFAAVVAKTALWIAESQMVAETEKILSQNIDFLPLKTNASIVEGNALRTDWATLKPIDGSELPDTGLFAGITTHVDGSVHHYDYIMGNPPFVGARLMSEEQKKDVFNTFGNIKNVGNLDYVACWYKKAADLLKGTDTRAALVSTNSITQGEQPAILWKPLMESGIRIDFAHRTFRWDSESTQKAHVHCVIVGFRSHDGKDGLPTVHSTESILKSNSCNRMKDGQETVPPRHRIFDGEKVEFAENINAYLVNAPDVFIESRSKALCDV